MPELEIWIKYNDVDGLRQGQAISWEFFSIFVVLENFHFSAVRILRVKQVFKSLAEIMFLKSAP